MLWDRMKYEKVQRQPNEHELVTTSSQEPLFSQNTDFTTLDEPSNPIQQGDYTSRSSKDELPPYILGQKGWRKAGWRVGASLAACSALFALLINVITAIWVTRNKGTNDGMSTLYTGSCKKTETMNTWIHLAINALSTLLLSGSNYCMQCLSAPTRDEIDKAHAKRKWLDIGVPSVRNLKNISSKKVILWWCLGLSSVPLHLMYNSVFFSAIATNDYNYLYAAEGFARGAWFNETRWPSDFEFNGKEIQKRAPTYENLTNRECIQAYAADFISDRKTLIVVVETDSVNGTSPKGSVLDVNFNNFDKAENNQYNPYGWMCRYSDGLGNECYKQLPDIKAHLDAGWTVGGGAKAKYCLSERVEESCSLHFSLALIIVVIVCNVGKLTAMSIIIFRLGDSKPLITVGDAVDSFMRDNDSTTKGMCLATWRTFDKFSKRYDWTGNPEPAMWKPTRQRWARAASSLRWFTCIALFSIAIITVLLLLIYGISQLKGAKDIKSLWTLGFGAVHGSSLVTGWSLPSTGGSGLIASVIVGNLPQPILSFLYLIFNGLCTCMLLSNEWGNFSSIRKPLRVSNPRGQQRSTYFLQLPYRWGIPLVVMSGILHWLVSQSIFLANVTVIDRNGIPIDTGGVTTCGYSPIAIIFTLVVGSLLLIFGIGVGFRQLNPHMPVAASCSAAISAACHTVTNDANASFLPVQWGVVETRRIQVDGKPDDDEVGHCCFSTGRVSRPVEGLRYAGNEMSDFEGISSALDCK